jgi:hypothetical protein
VHVKQCCQSMLIAVVFGIEDLPCTPTAYVWYFDYEILERMPGMEKHKYTVPDRMKQ